MLYEDNIAPILVLTDGNQTIGNDYEFVASKQKVYPIVFGDTIEYKDLSFESLLTVAAFNYAFETVELLMKDSRNIIKNQAEELFCAVIENESSCLFKILIKNIDCFNYIHANIERVKDIDDEDEQEEIMKVFNKSVFKKVKDKITNF